MSCSPNNNENNKKLKKLEIKKPKSNIFLLLNKLNAKKIDNNIHISNLCRKLFSSRPFDSRNENLSSENTSSLNMVSKDNIEKSRKTSKISNLNLDKYSNAVLFRNRISKHNNYFKRNKPYFYKDKILPKKINSLDELMNNKNVMINKNKYRIKNQFWTPEKRGLFHNIKSSKKLSINHSYQKYINNNSNLSSHSNRIKEKNDNKKNISRANSALFLPNINTINNDKYSFLFSLSDKDKEKIVINQNLKQLLAKIKKKIRPKKFVSSQSPSISHNINDSCIHKIEFGNSIIFEKTHLDGLLEKGRNEKRNKTLKKYEINEGYVDLNVLNNGNNVSFQTNLRVKDGLYFYEFGKYGRMETVEEKVHRIQKDKKEFKKLLERYNKNQINQIIENKDFENNTKKKYGKFPIINDNIYKDLYHMLIKNNK
jgi:hypothetical protein